MKNYNLSKFSKKDLLLLMNDYFLSLKNNGEVCADETMDFLKVYYEYVLRINQTNSELIKCVIHKEHIMESSVSAYMTYDTKYNCDVYVESDFFKLQGLDEISAHKISALMTDSAHEFQHVLQYHNTFSYFVNKDEKINFVQKLAKEVTSRKEAKKIMLAIDKHYTCINILHNSEVEANDMASIYSSEVLDALFNINLTKNIELANFLLDIKDCIKAEDLEWQQIYAQQRNILKRINTNLEKLHAKAEI